MKTVRVAPVIAARRKRTSVGDAVGPTARAGVVRVAVIAKQQAGRIALDGLAGIARPQPLGSRWWLLIRTLDTVPRHCVLAMLARR
jgi:hypothetical protein